MENLIQTTRKTLLNVENSNFYAKSKEKIAQTSKGTKVSLKKPLKEKERI